MSAQPMIPFAHPENSTNVRSQVLRFFEERWPGATARVLEPAMFTTRRRSMPDWERTVLRQGRRFDVGTPHGTLPAWSLTGQRSRQPLSLGAHGPARWMAIARADSWRILEGSFRPERPWREPRFTTSKDARLPRDPESS